MLNEWNKLGKKLASSTRPKSADWKFIKHEAANLLRTHIVTRQRRIR